MAAPVPALPELRVLLHPRRCGSWTRSCCRRTRCRWSRATRKHCLPSTGAALPAHLVLAVRVLVPAECHCGSCTPDTPLLAPSHPSVKCCLQLRGGKRDNAGILKTRACSRNCGHFPPFHPASSFFFCSYEVATAMRALDMDEGLPPDLQPGGWCCGVVCYCLLTMPLPSQLWLACPVPQTPSRKGRPAASLSHPLCCSPCPPALHSAAPSPMQPPRAAHCPRCRPPAAKCFVPTPASISHALLPSSRLPRPPCSPRGPPPAQGADPRTQDAPLWFGGAAAADPNGGAQPPDLQRSGGADCHAVPRLRLAVRGHAGGGAVRAAVTGAPLCRLCLLRLLWDSLYVGMQEAALCALRSQVCRCCACCACCACCGTRSMWACRRRRCARCGRRCAAAVPAAPAALAVGPALCGHAGGGAVRAAVAGALRTLQQEHRCAGFGRNRACLLAI